MRITIMGLIMGLLLLTLGCATAPKPAEPQGGEARYDADGNLIVPPEISATYSAPDLHAGYVYVFHADRFTPSLAVELYQTKLPLIRETNFVLGMGDQLIYLGVNKVWTSIYEISTGVIVGRDFEDDQWVIGIEAMVIKF